MLAVAVVSITSSCSVDSGELGGRTGSAGAKLRFVNCSGAHRQSPCLSIDGKLFFDPRMMLQPSTEQEVVAIVNQVRKDGRRLRVLGSGHSRSPLAVSDDLLVSICQLRGVVRVDKERKQVTVKGGTTLEELISVLHQHGLALSNLPAISDQTVAGTIATGWYKV